MDKMTFRFGKILGVFAPGYLAQKTAHWGAKKQCAAAAVFLLLCGGAFDAISWLGGLRFGWEFEYSGLECALFIIAFYAVIIFLPRKWKIRQTRETEFKDAGKIFYGLGVFVMGLMLLLAWADFVIFIL